LLDESRPPRYKQSEWRHEGEGTLTTESGVLSETQYSFRTRFDEGLGTNPDELIAASLGGCFSMALSNELGLCGSGQKQTVPSPACLKTKLRTPALSCEDVTGEKLAVLVAHNGEQMASLSADALAVVNILLGRYNKLDRTDEGIYLKAFSGDRCKVDRQSRESILVESPCLSAL
jgi:hypothetical protein